MRRGARHAEHRIAARPLGSKSCSIMSVMSTDISTVRDVNDVADEAADTLALAAEQQ
jgi:hypothetical protein